MRLLIALAIFSASLFGQASRQMPRHLVQESATPSARISPRSAAISHTSAVASAAGFNSADLAGIYVAREYTTAHNGVTHFRFREQFAGIDVYGAEWVVNVDRNGRVLNSGGTLFAHPGAGAIAPDTLSAPAALRAAVTEVRRRDPGSYVAIENPGAGKTTTRRFATSASGFADQAEGRPVWYAANGALHAGWVFRVPALNGVDLYETLVDDATQRVVAMENTTLYDGARGLVFERSSPQPNTTPGVFTPDPRPYVQRTLQSFAGDPEASPQGWVIDNRTAGNNVTAAPNPLGIRFLETADPVAAPNGDFSFPLELGPGAPNPMFFGEAATVNLFYWANRTHDLFYQAGFDEQAGNYQRDNLGRGGLGGDAMLAFSHFGAAANGRAALNNAFFSGSSQDGGPASINMYIGGSGATGVFSDGSFDAEVIVHEYTHGVHVRLAPVLAGYQGGAMGEGWADFFSLEFTTPDGAPLDGSYPQGEYLLQQFGLGGRTRPYSTNMDINPLTYASYGQVSPVGPESHADGEIWVSALWDMRANLITQFGEAEGRRRVRLLVIDGMKLSPPSATMIDMRDAILLADRVDFEGASQEQIWAAFSKRGIGIMAQSVSLYSTRVRACFETPSPAATLRLYEDDYIIGEPLRIALQDSNNPEPAAMVTVTASSGDSEKIALQRGSGSLFQALVPASASGAAIPGDSVLEVVPGDSLKIVHEEADSGGGAPRTIETTAALMSEYSMTTEPNLPSAVGPDERALVTVPPTGRWSSDNPTLVQLPFPFQFFSRTYKSAMVHSNGLVTFDGGAYTSSTYCNGRSNLLGKTAIAPLWMDLVYTRSGVQPNAGVFMSTGDGSVTFRWAAETQPTVTSTQPAPVNFSLTLHQDGRAVAQYGSGNSNLLNTSGCSIRPTVGIANGHEAYALMAGPAYDGQANLENAPALTFTPPFNGWGWSRPVAVVESPAQDTNFGYGALLVRGVAYDVELSVARVDILVDGVPRGQAAVGLSRPDACAQQQMRGCPNVGFSAALNMLAAGIAPGPHTLRIRATNTRGIVEDFPAEPIRFSVDTPGPAAGVIESPKEGDEVSGVVQVRGYAYAPAVRIVGVEVLVDGLTYGSAIYNQSRNDICGALSPAPPNCPGAGFFYSLNTKSMTIWLPNGSHSMQVRTRDELGRTMLFPETPLKFTVNNPANQLPKAVLAAPAPGQTLSGVVDISGYAWDPDGAVRTVYLIVDGFTSLPGGGSTSVSYGSARPDECAQLTDVAACPNIGFEGRLDTRLLSNGLHTLGVVVVDDRSASATFPRLARYGMNIYVQN